MRAALKVAIEQTLGQQIRSSRVLTGGDINEAYRIELEGGRCYFVKANQNAPNGMFAAEAKGLAWLAAPGVIRIPAVVASHDNGEALLVLEYLDSAQRVRDFDELLGRRLAGLHTRAIDRFGLEHDNFIGRLPQSNAPLSDWPTFYWSRRLEPQARHAVESGTLPMEIFRTLQRLEGRLVGLVGDPEPPARLHGDLWGGNLHADERGEPALIDPAAYAGHREVDLAMMRLFGGFSARVFAAYQEARPLQPGADKRVALYQLYPLLVHVNLFGASYVGAVERALRAYA